MWPTTNGVRKLCGDEAKLIRGIIGMMVDQLVAESRQESDQQFYGIEWFDSCEVAQRLWLLDQVTDALLTDADPPSPAAMLEATIDAIFAELFDLIVMEIDDPALTPTSWRRSAVAAFECQNGRPPKVGLDSVDQEIWGLVVTQIADSILGVRLYQQAESFRDGDFKATQMFLQRKGLPDNFLQQIPPLQSVDQTQAVIDRIQSFLF
ncbi:hypothetical protein [Planctomycetes bacterium K23_9]|uniref:Uncharacterized protein n=1 Tax=Stieleria marina TaxID=1930275 RepID=A0A517P3F9_9BACT|nr:hypothetical protein K239x_59250 [Planctomycetes bacterium K23_9]